MVWYGMAWYGITPWYGDVVCGMVPPWYGMIWHDMVWYCMAWHGIVCDNFGKFPQTRYSPVNNSPSRSPVSFILADKSSM